MKSLLVVCVCVLMIAAARTNGEAVQCSQEISALCPAEDGIYPVYLADPDDCSAFCQCSKGIAWHFKCQPNLLFNDHLNTCDWPNQVD
ncbi:hypothetical protein CGJ15_26995, partial [Vibrio parahaemolyticus]